MKRKLVVTVAMVLALSTVALAQRGPRDQRSNQRDAMPQNRGQQSPGRGNAMDVPVNKQAIGESGIAWYTTWETGLAEAKRSNRPIFFMSAATACSGVSGVF